MTYTSFGFYLFLAAVLLLYYAVPLQIRWTVLLAASCAFYIIAYRSGWWILLASAIFSYGAGKVTNYLGDFLKSRGIAGSKTVLQWERTKAYYKGVQKDCCLAHISDLDTYLYQLKDSRYSVFIASKGDCTSFFNESSAGLLARLGCRTELFAAQECGFLAVISGADITEQAGAGQLMDSGTIPDGSVTYELLSDDSDNSENSSIILDGTEQSKNSRGLNIVVYQRDTKKVIDTVCFDTGAEGSPAIR
ncbi:MAG: hypothetical protein K2N87_08650 [Eubacterium sp.]|nr:hypothetical protein [Eubacterium sp.]